MSFDYNIEIYATYGSDYCTTVNAPGLRAVADIVRDYLRIGGDRVESYSVTTGGEDVTSEVSDIIWCMS